MKLQLLIVLLFSATILNAQDIYSIEIMKTKIQNNELTVNSDQEVKDAIDALWDGLNEKELNTFQIINALDVLENYSLNAKAQLEIFSLRKELKLFSKGAQAFVAIQADLDRETALILAGDPQKFSKTIAKLNKSQLITYRKVVKELKDLKKFSAKTPEQIQALYFDAPDLDDYLDGKYRDAVRLFMFCRNDRRYPCLMLLKDIYNQPMYGDDGHLWSIPSLGYARGGLPFNVRNGYTPSGVHTIDSVMPDANNIPAFGKFRRLILNWVPQSVGEVSTLEFLPTYLHKDLWWQEANVARDVGRNHLRIHGTGRLNIEKESPWHPFRPTAGCVAMRENTYDEVSYQDQRVLLDKLMEASFLDIKYENETALKGILYVIEIDNLKKPVKIEDLRNLGLQ